MGAIPVLLIAAAIGVTYGWQPDRNAGPNQNTVEYIIQIPPDQLHRLEQTGEISSTIDQRVQGHVSRVIVRVGTGPLPRTTPSAISQLKHETIVPGESSVAARDRERPVETGARVDLNDQIPIPIPEMVVDSHGNPIPAVGANSTHLAGSPKPIGQSVMKPDSNNGGGFALPPTLESATKQATQRAREATNQTMNDLGSQARRGIDNAIGSAMDRIGEQADKLARDTSSAATSMLNQAESSLRGRTQDLLTRGNAGAQRDASTSVPPFTGPNMPSTGLARDANRGSNRLDERGSSLGMGPARTRSGGPSTDPTESRDANWYDLNSRTARTSQQDNRQPDPTTHTGVGINQTNRQVRADASESERDPTSPFASSTREERDNRGMLGTTQTFGKTPDALSRDYQVRDDRNLQTNDPRYTTNQHEPRYGNDTAYSRDSYERAQLQREEQERLQQERDEYQRQMYERERNLVAQERANDRLYGNQNSSQLGSAYGSIDPRLTPSQADQLPPGGWSFNAKGQAINRQGQLLDRYGRVVPDPALQANDLRTNSPDLRMAGRDSSGLGMANQNSMTLGSPGPMGNPNTSFTNVPNVGVGQYQIPGSVAQTNQQLPIQNPAGAQPPSASDLVANHGSQYAPARTDLDNRYASDSREEYSGSTVLPKRKAGSETLFNILFLISMLCNGYLLWWFFFHIRTRFRNMVMSQRVSNSHGNAAV